MTDLHPDNSQPDVEPEYDLFISYAVPLKSVSRTMPTIP